jgi:hypothetical protein
MTTVILVVLMIAAMFFVAAFLRALTARLATGKWPHQDERSKRIYDRLP